MFKKNPNRPELTIGLKKVSSGYKVIPNESFNPFSFKRITRAVFKSDLYPNQNANQQTNNINIGSNGTIIQPPLHVTLPAFAKWFDIDEIHNIQEEAFPEFFLEEDNPNKLFKKTPFLYKFYRNFMVSMWRENSKKYLSPAICRKNLPGDVSSIIRIHAFLQNWGIINFPSKEHIKGFVERTSKKMICYVCEEENSTVYYVAELEKGLLFQICECCFQGKVFPKSIDDDQFRKIITEFHEKRQRKKPTFKELKRILEIMHSQYPKQKEMWLQLAKQFPQYTKEEVLLCFLEIPATEQMNGNTFSSGEDIMAEKEPQDPPTVFENYQNPIQTNVALSYYLWKTQPEKYPELEEIFHTAEEHSNFLASQQSQKIKDLAKMLIDVQLSKLQLKSLFLQQFEKMIVAEEKLYTQMVSNKIAEGLKCLDIEEDDQ